MKKVLTLTAIIMMSLALVGCGKTSAQQQINTTSNNEQSTMQNNNKILVVYFSRTGNTRELAKQIQQKVGGDILELQTVTAYPAGYDATIAQARREIDSGFKPELRPIGQDIQAYDTIYVGSPIWWSTIAPPVAAFLTQYNMSGKTIIPFVTHEGSGFGRSVTNIKELCPQSTVKDGLSIRGGNVRTAQSDIDNWLKQLDVK